MLWCAFVAVAMQFCAPLAEAGIITRTRAVLLTGPCLTKADSLDAASCLALLRVCGLSPDVAADAEALLREDPRGLLMVIPAPAARALPPAVALRVLAHVRAGARLFTDGESPLREAAGFQLKAITSVIEVRDSSRPGRPLRWDASVPVPAIAVSHRRGDRVIYADAATGSAIGVLRRVGEGQICFLATMFDPITGEGYGRFPSLPSVLIGEMGATPAVRGAGAHAYFDAGYINNARDERRIRMWRDAGITAVHAGMWQHYADNPLDYRWLVETAHRYGIRAYLWVMWPYVGQGFWNAHPEWRQKNGALGDAKLDFLLLMDFQIPACFDTAMRDFASLLALDWDGVDIAEFSVTGGVADALQGAAKPENLVGFGAAARGEFGALHGFDPLALLDPASPRHWKRDSSALNAFYDYRAGVSASLLSRVVAAVDSMNRQRVFPLELVLTVLDDSKHPEFRRLLAYDGAFARTLAQRHGMTLHVEDPMSEWVRPPSRYAEMAATYRDAIGARPFAIDINVVPVHWKGQPGFPSAQATGMEFLLQWRAAQARSDYVTCYSEFSVYPEDWALLPAAMAADARIASGPAADTLRLERAGVIRSTAPVSLFPSGNGPEIQFPAGSVLLAPGTHVVTRGRRRAAQSAGIVRPRLYPVRGTHEVRGIDYAENGVTIRYRALSRMPLTCNGRPSDICIDGARVKAAMFTRRDGTVVFLPPGEHTAELFAPRRGR